MQAGRTIQQMAALEWFRYALMLGDPIAIGNQVQAALESLNSGNVDHETRHLHYSCKEILAVVATTKGSLSDALEMQRSCISYISELYPENLEKLARARCLLAVITYLHGDFEEALLESRSIGEHSSGDLRVSPRIGLLAAVVEAMTLAELDKPDIAAETLDTAIEALRKSAGPHELLIAWAEQYLALLYLTIGRAEQSLFLYAKALAVTDKYIAAPSLLYYSTLVNSLFIYSAFTGSPEHLAEYETVYTWLTAGWIDDSMASGSLDLLWKIDPILVEIVRQTANGSSNSLMDDSVIRQFEKYLDVCLAFLSERVGDTNPLSLILYCEQLALRCLIDNPNDSLEAIELLISKIELRYGAHSVQVRRLVLVACSISMLAQKPEAGIRLLEQWFPELTDSLAIDLPISPLELGAIYNLVAMSDEGGRGDDVATLGVAYLGRVLQSSIRHHQLAVMLQEQLEEMGVLHSNGDRPLL